MQNEVAELRASLLEQDRQQMMAQAPSSEDLISQVIQRILAQGLVMAPSAAFPHLRPSFPAQALPQHPVSKQSFRFHHMVRPHHVPYPPVQQVDDPNLWRVPGSSRPLIPPPLHLPLQVDPLTSRMNPTCLGRLTQTWPPPHRLGTSTMG